MSKAKKGDTVKVHYTGKLKDDTIFDSSREREPLEFTVGAGQMIEGFDKAVEGMEAGDAKKVEIPSDEAYGGKRDDMIVKVEKNQLPADMKPEVGMQLQATQDNGETQVLTIANIEDDHVVLDGNHPLAGQDLVFDIELVEVK